MDGFVMYFHRERMVDVKCDGLGMWSPVLVDLSHVVCFPEMIAGKVFNKFK